MLDEEDELNTNEVTTSGKPTPINWSNPIRRVRCKKTHWDSLRYRRNILRVVSMPNGQNATEGGSIGETITIRSKENTLLWLPMKQLVKVTTIKRKVRCHETIGWSIKWLHSEGRWSDWRNKPKKVSSERYNPMWHKEKMTNKKERWIHRDKSSLEEKSETVGARSDGLIGMTYTNQKDKKVIEGTQNTDGAK